MSRIALTDVARQAGVSTSTASRVLNKSQVTVPISEHTRTRVETAASELGYRPSAAARALLTGQTRTFGVLGNNMPPYLQPFASDRNNVPTHCYYRS